MIQRIQPYVGQLYTNTILLFTYTCLREEIGLNKELKKSEIKAQRALTYNDMRDD